MAGFAAAFCFRVSFRRPGRRDGLARLRVARVAEELFALGCQSCDCRVLGGLAHSAHGSRIQRGGDSCVLAERRRRVGSVGLAVQSRERRIAAHTIAARDGEHHCSRIRLSHVRRWRQHPTLVDLRLAVGNRGGGCGGLVSHDETEFKRDCTLTAIPLSGTRSGTQIPTLTIDRLLRPREPPQVLVLSSGDSFSGHETVFKSRA